VPEEKDGASGPGESASAVVAALRKLARPASPEEVAAATGLPEKSVRRALGHLVARREARRAGGGRFTAARAR
jgi:DNA-binding IclR family transcriptional regulator